MEKRSQGKKEMKGMSVGGSWDWKCDVGDSNPDLEHGKLEFYP